MDNKKLAEAVVALKPVPNLDAALVRTLLKSHKLSELSALAFECHKALIDKTEWCKILSDDGMKQYTYKPNSEVRIEGLGNTDEEAIFKAVLDWFSKRGEG